MCVAEPVSLCRRWRAEHDDVAEPVTAPNTRGHCVLFEWRFYSPAAVGEFISFGHRTPRMKSNNKEGPNRALLFGFLAWASYVLYRLIPDSVYGQPAQFNFMPGISMLFFFGVGAILALIGAFQCWGGPSLSPAQRTGAVLLNFGYLVFSAVSFAREWH
jgi:hypothetical protein